MGAQQLPPVLHYSRKLELEVEPPAWDASAPRGISDTAPSAPLEGEPPLRLWTPAGGTRGGGASLANPTLWDSQNCEPWRAPSFIHAQQFQLQTD